jgi:release factor glutamine methyltransferase
MFVQSNTIRATQNYVKSKLGDLFSETEIRKIVKLIICKRLGWSDTDFVLNQENRLSESDLLYVRSIVNRLLNGEPFQYILGETDFFGLSFFCTPAVLIPRPETEELVQLILNSVDQKSSLKIVDLCTGSGCIGISLAANLPVSNVILTDISTEALQFAQKSADLNKIKIESLCHDVLHENAFDSFDDNSLDVIVSNPPYIPIQDKAQMKNHVLEYEPHIALFVENSNPLVFYQKISENARKLLKPTGHLFFEINPEFSNELVKILDELGFVNIELMKDLQGKYRMLKAQNA